MLQLKSTNSLADATQTEVPEEATAFVNENADRLKKVLSYLEKTRAEEKVKIDDQMSQLLSLSKGELMYAYDELLKELDARE